MAMTITFDKVERYLKKLGRNYSIVFTFIEGPLRQLKIHFSPHSGEYYYSFRNTRPIDIGEYTSISEEELENISFYAGLLVSSFDREEIGNILSKIDKLEQFPIQRAEVLERHPRGERKETA